MGNIPNTCTDNLCREKQTTSPDAESHVIVPYQERETTSPNTESCHIHPEFSYDMACQECKLPVCIRCMKENHEGHTFKSIKNTLKDTEKPCGDKIQNAEKNILPKLPGQQISKYGNVSEDISIGSPVQCLEFDMPYRDLCQISCVSEDKVWVGDSDGQIILMDKTGKKLDEIKTNVTFVCGYHTLTYDGDLLYVDKSNNSIKKYTSDRKTTTVVLTTGDWEPLCVYSSHRTGDILVELTDGKNCRVVRRYNEEGRELWQSQYDAQGQRIYGSPMYPYITENVNGDTCTSDGGSNQAVVVVDRDGNHRFTYRGEEDETEFIPYGICTDVHGRILVVVNVSCVHMIDQNGEFITALLTWDHGLCCEYGLCTDSDNNIWLCGEEGVKMYKYLN